VTTAEGDELEVHILALEMREAVEQRLKQIVEQCAVIELGDGRRVSAIYYLEDEHGTFIVRLRRIESQEVHITIKAVDA
jgi:hypothetical protein